MTDHVSPLDERLAAVAAHPHADDQPVVMLNLNRYHHRAQYPAGTTGVDVDVSGREAYLRYGVVAYGAIQSVGGEILWATDAAETVIGCDHDEYDEVVAVWYPSRHAFLALAAFPGYMEALAHREAAIEQAALIATRGEATPVLTQPFAR
ncbi:MAG: DUF1330 domain-containing protein [Acidimicrobiia bacterium]